MRSHWSETIGKTGVRQARSQDTGLVVLIMVRALRADHFSVKEKDGASPGRVCGRRSVV
jgi:hypothetical protein